MPTHPEHLAQLARRLPDADRPTIELAARVRAAQQDLARLGIDALEERDMRDLAALQLQLAARSDERAALQRSRALAREPTLLRRFSPQLLEQLRDEPPEVALYLIACAR